MASRRKAGKSSRKRTRKTTRKASRRWCFPWLRLALVALVLLGAWCVWLDVTIRSQFEGRRWALPAKVYARPLELYSGLALSPARFEETLRSLGYRHRPFLQRPGDFSRDGTRFHLYTRAFRFWDGEEPSRRLQVIFDGSRVARLALLDDGQVLDLLRLEPQRIASIYPAHKEDRILIRLEQAPPLLIQTLLAVEDRDFYRHHGISPRSVARAMLANLRAGGVVQGGSTLTQQLVKNFFLSSERSLWRKANEALMSLLLELHYSKDEILEAYLNEIYLGQDGARAIHGFGLASRFYFDRPLAELSPDQVALLVGLVKGPSYYDPRRHPQRARRRRDLVLGIMAEQGLIDTATLRRARAHTLDTVTPRPVASNAHPAFLDLVRRQLYRDYREEDLRSAGLSIFTTLDPRIQRIAERSLDSRLASLERAHGLPDASLQGALVVVGATDGEVLALVGDRHPKRAGFNRALEARRPIGSLVKPAVYLTALERPDHYTLATLLEDAPLEVPDGQGGLWTPANYDRTFRGPVLLHDALVQSLNVPTARLGLALGVDAVIDTLHRLGIDRDFRPYPSLLLGTAELTPWEVAQAYQTLAAGGFRTPLRAIRAVSAADGTPLQRYPLEVRQAVAPVPAFLLDSALQDVVREGTARALAARFGAGAGIAGKTGTTDDLRDSWFAGFDGAVLTVAWVGRDDNRPMGLTGAAGALRLWADAMAAVGITPLVLPMPEGIEIHAIDRKTGLLADKGCEDRLELPFSKGSAPRERAPCAGRGPAGWLERLFR